MSQDNEIWQGAAAAAAPTTNPGEALVLVRVLIRGGAPVVLTAGAVMKAGA